MDTLLGGPGLEVKQRGRGLRTTVSLPVKRKGLRGAAGCSWPAGHVGPLNLEGLDQGVRHLMDSLLALHHAAPVHHAERLIR